MINKNNKIINNDYVATFNIPQDLNAYKLIDTEIEIIDSIFSMRNCLYKTNEDNEIE